MRISDWSSDVCSSDLDVEVVVARFELGEIEDAFVGGERQHPLDAVELVLAAARAGLFEQRHACLDQRRQQSRQAGRTVSLVGVDADPRIRAARTYRTYARGIEIRNTGELELQRARLRESGGAFGHHARGSGGHTSAPQSLMSNPSA